MSLSEMFARYARNCSATLQQAIELENEPNTTKQLRDFSTKEMAGVLGKSDSYIRMLVSENADFPQGTTRGSARRFTIHDIHAARDWLYKKHKKPEFAPRRKQNESLQVLAFVNFKGGSGKTTSAANFAQYAALHGYRVLLLDLDPQASATTIHGISPWKDVSEKSTFAAWVRAEGDEGHIAENMQLATYWPGLNLVPASLALQEVEYEFVARLQQDRGYPFYGQVKAFLQQVDDSYDIVVIDCRPDVGFLTGNALSAATGLIVPMPASMIDLASSGEFFRFLSETCDPIQSLDPSYMQYSFVKILTTKFKPTDQNQQMIQGLANVISSDAVLKNPMLETAAMDAAGLAMTTLYEYSPPSGGQKSYARALDAMNAVNAEVLTEVHKAWGRK